MAKNTRTFPAIFLKMTPRVDKSWKLEFETRELFGKDIEQLANLLGAEGWLAYSPNDDITMADIPEVVADSGMEGKTPSQRLRNSLYVLWDQRGKPSGKFDPWYLGQMENLIETVKSKLEQD